jgi:NTP pyrophosphatase (non-canonical NTP hydrolase)
MQDNQTKLQELKDTVQAFREKRGWDNEDPKDAAIGLVLEAGEVLEHFQWKTGEEVEEEARLKGPICDEIADVLWYVFMLANRLDIDIAQAFERKYRKNEEKWPVEQFKPDMDMKEKMRTYYQIKAKYRGGHPLAEED